MFVSILPHFPALATYAQKPTWVNRAGRIDRSACLEIRASELRRRAAMRDRGRKPNGQIEACGEIVVTGEMLLELHRHRMPFTLWGDFRTRKANAMRDPREVDTQQRMMFNPNKGASRKKLLGFFAEPDFLADWSQTVRIERRRMHEKLAQHFLICPNCDKKFLKLFTVLCSKQELNDALSAESWIAMAEARYRAIRRPLDHTFIELRSKLVRRYGILFRRRRLMCRTCLKLRYGEVKPNAGRRTRPEIHADIRSRIDPKTQRRKERKAAYDREYARRMREGLPPLRRAQESCARANRIVAAAKRFERFGAILTRRYLTNKRDIHDLRDEHEREE